MIKKLLTTLPLFILFFLLVNHVWALQSYSPIYDCSISPTSIAFESCKQEIYFSISAPDLSRGTTEKPEKYRIDIGTPGSRSIQHLPITNDGHLNFSYNLGNSGTTCDYDGNISFYVYGESDGNTNTCKTMSIPKFHATSAGSCSNGASIKINDTGHAIIKADTDQANAPLRASDTYHIKLVACNGSMANQCAGTTVGEWGGGYNACQLGSTIANGFDTGKNLSNDRYTAYISNCGSYIPTPLGNIIIGESNLCLFSINRTSDGTTPVENNNGCAYCPKDPASTYHEPPNPDDPESSPYCVNNQSGDSIAPLFTNCNPGTICIHYQTVDKDGNTVPPCAPAYSISTGDDQRAQICPGGPGNIVNGTCKQFNSGLGIYLPTKPEDFINILFGVILSIAGGIALILIIISGYRIMASQGNPEKLQAAREQLTAAIVGLLFIIFSLVFLETIGYDILRIPGFGK